MEIIRAWEVPGTKIPAPFARTCKCLVGPQRGNVSEISFNFAFIDPHSQTDYHKHESPELIYVVWGRGIGSCDGMEDVEICADTILWIRAGEKHQIKNTGEDPMKLATVFVPPLISQRVNQTNSGNAK